MCVVCVFGTASRFERNEYSYAQGFIAPSLSIYPIREHSSRAACTRTTSLCSLPYRNSSMIMKQCLQPRPCFRSLYNNIPWGFHQAPVVLALYTDYPDGNWHTVPIVFSRLFLHLDLTFSNFSKVKTCRMVYSSSVSTSLCGTPWRFQRISNHKWYFAVSCAFTVGVVGLAVMLALVLVIRDVNYPVPLDGIASPQVSVLSTPVLKYIF